MGITNEFSEGQDSMLVHIKKSIRDDNGHPIDDKVLSTFYVKKYAEFIRFIWYCKEHEIPAYFNEYTELDVDDLCVDRIEEVYITIPTDHDMSVINIVV